MGLLKMALIDEDKQWLTEQFSRFAAKEGLEHVETSLFTEFHKWASPMEARQRTHTATLRAVDAEMEYLADRVTKLEGNKAS